MWIKARSSRMCWVAVSWGLLVLASPPLATKDFSWNTRTFCEDGTCVNKDGGFTCTCSPGWTGQNCLQDIDECTGNTCQHGRCVNKDGGYKCTCSPGWTGQNCNKDINECSGNPCEHGHCVNKDGGYKCICSAGWTGQNCQQDINECTRGPCVHGYCVNKDSGYKCACPLGWTGQNCQQDIDECTGNPCQHGTCVNKDGGYKCTCSPRWTGQNCQQECEPIKLDRCSSRLPYSWTKFPSALGIPDQGLALTVAPVVFSAIDVLQLSAYSPDLETVLCSFFFQDCKSDEVRLPCRSFCQEVLSSCVGPEANQSNLLQWEMDEWCSSEKDCIAPTVHNQTAPSNRTVVPQKSSECHPLHYRRCSALIPKTRFPDMLMHQNQDTAIAAAKRIFSLLDMNMPMPVRFKCRPHLDAVVCAVFFPTCEPDGMMLPCRSLCHDIITSCVAPVLYLGGWPQVAHLLTTVGDVCNFLPDKGCIL